MDTYKTTFSNSAKYSLGDNIVQWLHVYHSTLIPLKYGAMLTYELQTYYSENFLFSTLNVTSFLCFQKTY